MKIFARFLLAAAAAGILLVPVASQASCGQRTSQARDSNGNVTGADTLAALPDGGVVYGDTDAASYGYAGIVGPHGFLDVSGSGNGVTVQGQSNDAPLDGKAGAGADGSAHLCIADTQVL